MAKQCNVQYDQRIFVEPFNLVVDNCMKLFHFQNYFAILFFCVFNLEFIFRASEGRLPERSTHFQNILNISSDIPVEVEYMEEAVLFKSGYDKGTVSRDFRPSIFR
jgi:hypothetical protein